MQRLIRDQWPAWVSGVLIGTAEVLHYWRYGTFVTFTTAFGSMFAAVEALFVSGEGPLARAYGIDVGWLSLGVIAGGSLVALMEREFRSWVRYEPRALLLAFSGAVLFSFGTRLAGGCTTHHVLGGLGAMSIASVVVTLLMLIVSPLGLWIYARLGIGYHFKPQETKRFVRQAREFGLSFDAVGYDPTYNPRSDRLRWATLAIALLFFGAVLGGGLFGDWPGSISQIGPDLLLLLLTGLLMGVGVGKTGFGTACALLSPNVALMIGGREHEAVRHKIGYLTRRMFVGLFPFTAVLTAILILQVAMLVGWLLFDRPAPGTGAMGELLHIGHLLGAPLLALGSVWMLGCEIRTYTRLGLGYMTALVALPGFAVGYLPHALFSEEIDSWLQRHVLLSRASLVELAGTGQAAQVATALGYTAVLAILLALSLRYALRETGLRSKDVIASSTEGISMKRLLRGHPAPELTDDRDQPGA